MNILLWVLQILLAFYNFTGGIYTMFNYDKIKSPLASDLPKPVWITICVLQIFFALCLVVPGALGVFPKLTSIAAIYLALNALAGCALFITYSGPGMLWAILPAALLGFVAYGRMVLNPF